MKTLIFYTQAEEAKNKPDQKINSASIFFPPQSIGGFKISALKTHFKGPNLSMLTTTTYAKLVWVKYSIKTIRFHIQAAGKSKTFVSNETRYVTLF